VAIFPEIPGYQIERKLSESGMAEVFVAIQKDLQRQVVIKRLNPELFRDKVFFEKFIKEAKKASKFVHPNIANILEVGATGNLHYIVMEYLPESLRDKINRQFAAGAQSFSGGLEIERGSADFQMDQEPDEEPEGKAALDVLKPLAWALDYAHKNGVIHQNIRPENIRFRVDGTPTLVDFFISMIVDSETREALKKKGIVFGSSHYRSPEQALKKPLDQRSDFYSLGVVFYEMLTGSLPYDAEESIATENQHIMESVPQLPAQLKIYQPLLDAMMAKDIEARVASGVELVRLIDEISNKPAGKDSRKLAQKQQEAGKPKLLAEQQIAPKEPIEKTKLEPETRKWEYRKVTTEANPLKLLLKPKILVAAAAVVVVVVVLLVVMSSKQSPDSAGLSQGQKKQTAVPDRHRNLSKEEQEEEQRKDLLFQHAFQLAERFLHSGEYQKALEKLNEAEAVKTTPESKQLAEQIKVKLAEKKDRDAFQSALSTGTSAAVADYLQQFPAGFHAKEAAEKLKEFKEKEKQEQAERQRILAAMIRLRSQYQQLSGEQVKAMLVKWGFFERYYNKSGDFKNHFELKVLGSDKVVVDIATGLIWHQSGSETYMGIDKARQWLAALNEKTYAGYSDWRLPTLEEAASLLERSESRVGLFIDPIFSREQSYIWTGDTFDKSKGWAIDFFSGDMNKVDLTYNVFIRPVRTMMK
jgi:serine/threonine protein kinase